MDVNNMIKEISNIFKCSCGGSFKQTNKEYICSLCGNKVKSFDDVLFFLRDDTYYDYLYQYKHSVILPQLEYLQSIVQDNAVAEVHIERLQKILFEINQYAAVTNKHCYKKNINTDYAQEMNNDNYIVSSYSPYINNYFSFSESHYSTLLRMVGHLQSNSIVLDVGCGVGRVLKDISESNPNCVAVGCDIQLTKLHLTNRILCTDDNVKYISIQNFKYEPKILKGFNYTNTSVFYSDLNEELPISNNTIDVVILSFILGLLDDYKKSLINVVRLIKKDGYLLIADDYGWHSNIRPSTRIVTPGQVEEILCNNGFEKVSEIEVPYLGVLTDRVANAHIIRLTKYKKNRI